MRAIYKVPNHVKRNIINELYLYWKNKKELDEIEQEIVDESPNNPEVNIKPKNKVSKPAESKALRIIGTKSTRAFIIAQRRIGYIENAIKRLNDEDREVFELIFRDGYSQQKAYFEKGVSKDTYYNVYNKIIYLVAIEFGEI